MADTSIPRSPTFLWHDYETFGLDARYDRPVQFAALRTDLNFNPVADPVMLYCQPADDYLPSPHACLVTGITPQYARQKGLPEFEFMQHIQAMMSLPNTCVVGYNSLRFDDEFTRHGLYRNMFDVYAREWQGGNSRWDLMDLVRAAASLRPEGMHWPVNEVGTPSLKLDTLAPANGIEHSNAHDALADVNATLALAQKIKAAQPQLYHYYFKLRQKHMVWTHIDIKQGKPFLHVSGMYSAAKGYLAWVLPVGMHPTNKNSLLVYDLRQDPRQWANQDVEQLHAAIFNPSPATDDAVSSVALPTRPPIKAITVNRCPFVAPVNVLPLDKAAKFGINPDVCSAHADWLRQHPEFCQRLIAAYTHAEAPSAQDLDATLYSGGFFSDQDKRTMQAVHATPPEQWLADTFTFKDERLNRLLMRMKARSYKECLSPHELAGYEAFRRTRLIDNPPKGVRGYVQFEQELNALNIDTLTPQQQALLKELYQYSESIYPVLD